MVRSTRYGQRARQPSRIKRGIREAGERRQVVQSLKKKGYIVRETAEGVEYYKPEPRKILSRQEYFEKHGHVRAGMPRERRVFMEKDPETGKWVDVSGPHVKPGPVKREIKVKVTKEGAEVIGVAGFTPSQVEKEVEKLDLEKIREEQKSREFMARPAWKRHLGAAAQASVTTGAAIVAFPEFIAEEAVGRVHSLAVGEGLKSRQYIPADFPVSRERIAEHVATRDVGAPPGAIGLALGMGKGIERAKKDPLSTGIATAMEVATFWAAGKAVHVGKVALRRGMTKVGLPSLERYAPGQVGRRVYWKAKEKAGLATYIPEEKVWDPGVVAGRTRFAEAKGPKEMLGLFKETKVKGEMIGIHAAPRRFPGLLRKKTVIGVGTSESPGLSVSAMGKGSPHFLKVSQTTPSYAAKTTLLPRFLPKRPTAPMFGLKDVYRLPKGLRKAPYKDVSKYMMKQPRGKYAMIAAKAERGGPEIEAIITTGTKAEVVSKRAYTTFRGVAVPLPKMRITDVRLPKIVTRGAAVKAKVGRFISPSYGEAATPLISPSYMASYASISRSSFKSQVSRPSRTAYPSSSLSLSVSRAPSKPYYPSKPSKASYVSKSSYPSKYALPVVVAPTEKKKKKLLIVKKKKKVKGGARKRVHAIKLPDIGRII